MYIYKATLLEYGIYIRVVEYFEVQFTVQLHLILHELT